MDDFDDNEKAVKTEKHKDGKCLENECPGPHYTFYGFHGSGREGGRGSFLVGMTDDIKVCCCCPGGCLWVK